MYPKGEMCKGIQTIRFLVVIQETAAVPPATTLVLCNLGGLPSPRPIKRHGGGAFGGVISDELDVGIIL
jgi:hypothetical protein